MSTTTNNAVQATTRTNSRPATFSKSAWDKSTYAAYMGLIAIVERRSTIPAFLKDHAALFTNCGIPADEAHMVSLLIAMAKDTTKDGEKVRKVNPIGSLRSFFNRTWAEKDALPVSYKVPAVPNPKPRQPKAKKSAEEVATEWFSKMDAAQKAAFIAKLMGENAA